MTNAQASRDVPEEWMLMAMKAYSDATGNTTLRVRAAIAVVAPMIQAAERERAAKMVEDFGCHDCEMDTDLAAAIRDIPEETGDE